MFCFFVGAVKSPKKFPFSSHDFPQPDGVSLVLTAIANSFAAEAVDKKPHFLLDMVMR
jgi:hypothetical protein